MELQDHYDAIAGLDTEVIAIARLERDPALLGRITDFVHNGFPLVADPEDAVQEHFETYGAYVADKQGVVRSFIPGTKDARPRLDMVIEEVARVAGLPAPRMRREFGKLRVTSRGAVPERAPGQDRTAGPDGTAGPDRRAAPGGGIAAPRDGAPESPPSVLSVRWMWSHDSVRPGDELKLALLPEIAPGWHVYAHDEARMTPLTVELELPNGLLLTEPVRYPAGVPTRDPVLDIELSMHAVDAPLPALVLRAADDLAPGDLVVRARLTFQACGDGVCLPPATTTVVMPLRAAKADSERGQVYGWQGW